MELVHFCPFLIHTHPHAHKSAHRGEITDGGAAAWLWVIAPSSRTEILYTSA